MAGRGTPDCSVATMEASCRSHKQFRAADGLPPINNIGIHKFYKLIGEHPPESAEEDGGRETRKSRRPRLRKVTNERTESQARKQGKAEHAFGTFEVFIDVLESSLKDLEKNEIEIYKYRSLALAGHPRGTKARPDAIIFRRDYSRSEDEDKLSWGLIEMAIGYHSSGKTHERCLKKVATYVMYLLEARPDLVSALGLLVERDHIDFFFCNVEEINRLSLSKEEDYIPLLSAVMKYLNGGQKKNLDSTLSRVPGTVLFDVSVPNGSTSLGAVGGPQTTYPSCSLRYAHDPFGRRPSVFIYEPKNNVAAIRVIKDQYIKKNRRWTEKDILDKIHADGTYPAVVRMCIFGKITEATCGDRIRVRICLQDYGTDFLSLKTPRDVVYAPYDLLEVTRSLYSDRKVLHRDISPWNIMIRDSENTQDIEPCSSASPVFIRHLLDPHGIPKHKTSIFLIDFGYSQDFESSEPRSERRTGTPMFIARAVQTGRPLPSQKFIYFPELPLLSEGIREVYESKHPKRMKSFPETLGSQIGPSKNPLPTFFQHKLEHDGESSVWTSFWWSILSFPEHEADVPINFVTWAAMMPRYAGSRKGLPKSDKRDMALGELIKGDTDIFHPGYGGLHDLFQNIAEVISPDYHWAEHSIRRRSDFVHELLQRIILNFVIENMNAPFMDKKKADKNRTVKGVSSTPYSSASETNVRHSSSMASSASSRSRKRKLKGTNLDPTPPISAMTDADEFGDNSSDCHDDLDDEDTQRFAKKSRTGDAPVINVQTE